MPIQKNIKIDNKNTIFQFKHNFIVNTLEDNILLSIINAIKEFGENPKKANLSWMEKEISELREVYKDNEYKFNDLALIEKYL